MPDLRAALTRKIGPLPVVAWGAIIGGGILVAKVVGIGGGSGAGGESVQVGAGGALPDAFEGDAGGGGGGGAGSGGGDYTPTAPIDIPGVPDGLSGNDFFDWLLHAPGSIITPPSGDTPGTIQLPDPTPTGPGGSIITPPADWWDALPSLPTITPAPTPSQPAIPVPGTPVPDAGGLTATLQTLIARVTFLREHEGAAASAYRVSNPIPGTETIAQRIARLTAEAAALTAARIKRLAAEVTTLRSKYPIAAAAWRKSHPIPTNETPEQRERRLTAEVTALRSATR